MHPAAQPYRTRGDQTVTAVQLNLEFKQLDFQKWGGPQRALPGDWLVYNNGDTYTVEQSVFAQTYQLISPGQYRKTSTIWAWPADAPGTVATLEGHTAYQAGDYLVCELESSEPSYAIAADVFERQYRVCTGRD